MSATNSNKTRKNVYKRIYYRCALCDNDQAIQTHHVMPRSIGGTDTEKNLITLCMYCRGEMHGTHFPERPEWMDAEYTRQAIIEYMSDLYVGTDGAWWPFD